MVFKNKLYLCIEGKQSKRKGKEIKKVMEKKIGSYALPSFIYFFKRLPLNKTGEISEEKLWKLIEDI